MARVTSATVEPPSRSQEMSCRAMGSSLFWYSCWKATRISLGVSSLWAWSEMPLMK